MRDRKLTSYDHAYLSLTIIHKTIVATDILTTVSSFILTARNGNSFPTRTHRSFNSLGDESKPVLDRIIVSATNRNSFRVTMVNPFPRLIVRRLISGD